MSEAPVSPRVLVVDDDDTFRGVLSSELKRRGHDVVVASTGREAVEVSASSGADVVLLDLRLPDMDGLQVLAEIRERQLPLGVVVLTGHGTIDTAIQATKPTTAAGCTRCSSKSPTSRRPSRARRSSSRRLRGPC